MKNNTAIFNADKKTIIFTFKDEKFIIDLTEGDLEDSWNSIISNGKIYDTNFYLEGEEYYPTFTLYRVKRDGNGELQMDTADGCPIEIIKQVGTKKQYFK